MVLSLDVDRGSDAAEARATCPLSLEVGGAVRGQVEGEPDCHHVRVADEFGDLFAELGFVNLGHPEIRSVEMRLMEQPSDTRASGLRFDLTVWSDGMERWNSAPGTCTANVEVALCAVTDQTDGVRYRFVDGRCSAPAEAVGSVGALNIVAFAGESTCGPL